MGEDLSRKKYLSKSFKTIVGAAVFLISSHASAVYDVELAEDSTYVNLLPGGSTAANPPHSSHSNHSSRSWR